MLLGGLRYLLPVIKAAHEQGYYVITCDYLPNNIAHQFSDEYCNVSIIDKEAVLAVAKEKNIDGIISFAVDPGVVTAAYVQQQMGLPSFGPYESVCILQNKDLFRAFLTKNGFNVPKAKSYSSVESALADIEFFSLPMIVKPTDSAGSKGVTRVDDYDDIQSALECAMKYSISGKIIIEDFIEKSICSSDSDCFSVNGKLKFVSFSAQRFDETAANPYTPSAYSWPSAMTIEQEEKLVSEVQRLLTLLKMKTSIYNIESRVGIDGKTYIMEVSPRGGGNRLAEMLRKATGVDMITNAVRVAVGDSILEMEQLPYNGYWAEIILHADNEGTFQELSIGEDMKQYVIEEDLWVGTGDQVSSFSAANDAIGTLVLKFSSQKELEEALSCQNDWLKVVVE
mgnify:CR=1 FL=1